MLHLVPNHFRKSSNCKKSGVRCCAVEFFSDDKPAAPRLCLRSQLQLVVSHAVQGSRGSSCAVIIYIYIYTPRYIHIGPYRIVFIHTYIYIYIYIYLSIDMCLFMYVRACTYISLSCLLSLSLCIHPYMGTCIWRPAPPSPRAIEKLLNVPSFPGL